MKTFEKIEGNGDITKASSLRSLDGKISEKEHKNTVRLMIACEREMNI